MSTHTKRGSAKEVIVLRPDMHVPRWESVLEEAAQAPTMLIVDDIDLNRRLLKAMLKTAQLPDPGGQAAFGGGRRFWNAKKWIWWWWIW